MQWPRLSRVFIAAGAAAVTSAFFIDFCDLVYRCGCRSLWAGADAACNVHVHGVKHCPWCSIGMSGALAVWGTIVAVQAFMAMRPGGAGMVSRIILSIGAFPVVGGILALALGVWLGYWE